MANPVVNEGAFIPLVQPWDVAEIYSMDVKSPEFKELIVRLYQNMNSMASTVNIKDSAHYTTSEFVNGQVFFPDPALNSTTAKQPTPRQVYRLVVNFGVLPNSAAKSVAHGLTVTAGFTFTRLYGAASDTTHLLYTPIPNTDIKLAVTNTNVTITTTADYSAYNISYVVLEYLKS